MKTTLYGSNSMRKAHVPMLAAALLAAAFLPRVIMAGIQIEQAQREYQARYYFLTGGYCGWPACPCGMPAPAFPPNGFYGDLDKNQTNATKLVQDLASKFYPQAPAIPIYGSFLNTPDGQSGIIGTPYVESQSPVNNYLITDVSPYVAGANMADPYNTITEANHKECFQKLRSYLQKLKYVTTEASMTNAAISAGAGFGTNSCGEAKGMAEAEFGGGWGYDIGQADVWFHPKTTSSKDTNPPAPPTGLYYAYKAALRGQIYNDSLVGHPGFIQGKLLVYLVCTTNSENGTGATSPPVGTDQKYYLFETSSVVAGTPYCSPMIGGSPFDIAGGCPLDGSAVNVGWSMLWAYLVLAPEFKTDPDDIHCSDGSCSSAGCQHNLPGSVSLGPTGLSLQISMGLDQYASPAGYFYLRAEQPSQSLYDPQSLLYSLSVPPTIGFGTDNGGIIWSPCPCAQANVMATGSGFTVYFTNYNASPPQFVASVTVVSNNSPAQMLVTELLGTNGTPRTFEFNYTTNGPFSGTWDVVQGGGVRTQSCLTVSDSAGNQTRTIQVKDSHAAVSAQTSEQYTAYPWGLTLAQRIVGSGSSAQTNNWTYYTDTNSPGSYGQLAAVVEPSGRWERYQYDSTGRLTNRVAQFGNNPTNTADTANRVTQISYSNNLVTTVERLLDTEISRTYELNVLDPDRPVEQILTIRCADPAAGIADPSNLTNIVWRATDSTLTGTAWDTLAELRPDGTMTFYQRSGSQTIIQTGDPGWTWSSKVNWTFGNYPNQMDGTQTTTTRGDWNETLSVQVQDMASGLTLDQQTYIYTDDLRRSHTVSYPDGRTETFTYACCGLDTYVDRDGATTQYFYDAARRQVASSRLGITTTNVLDASGNVLKTIRIGTDTPPITLRQAAYDWAGMLTSETNALNGVTLYTQTVDGGQTVKTTTYPDGGTRVETYYQDGSLLSVSGSASYPLQYLYGVDGDGPYTTEIKVANGGGTNEWVKTSTDMLGRPYKTVFARASAPYPTALSTYNIKGQLTNQIDPEGVITLYAYNPKGEQVYSVLDSNRNYTIDFSGTDKITFTTNDVITDNDTTVRRTQTFVWNTFNSGTASLVSISEASADGLQSWQTQYRDPNTPVISHSQTVYGANGSRTVTTTAPDASYSIATYQYGRLSTVSRYDSGSNLLSSISYAYDPHGRQSAVTDARNGTTSYIYNDADLVTSMTTPRPGTLGGSPQTTITYYNQMLQPTNVVNPDGTSISSEFHLTGQLKRQYGSRTYPVGYSYDYAGRLKTMTNWSGFPSTGARVTTWNYNQYRGWLDSKTYEGAVAGPSYAYTSAGRLQSRAWARGITTTYDYNWAGMLASVTYSDSTPALSYGYDRLGRQATAAQNSMTATLAYNAANQLLSESFTGGTLAGISVTNGYDQYLRRTDLGVQSSGAPLLHHSFDYDAASRLQTVTDSTGSPTYSATYSYLVNSPQVSQITFKQSSTTRMTTTKQWDYLNRLVSVSSAPSAGSPLNFSYSYNAANQRTRTTLADNSYWLLNYDSLGQVTSGHKYWPDQTPIAGQQFDYTFDTIGNRTSSKVGGDQNGANQRAANYGANSLNQYTNRDVPAAFDVTGLGFATNAVTLNGQAAYRKGEYFRAEVPVSNGSTSVWQSVTIAATNQTTVSGNVYLPKNQEQFFYDGDGNLTNDGRWSYTWDAENRLVKLAPNTSIGPRNSLRFEYDWQGRRIHKQVWSNTGWTGYATNDVKFVYDGWNLLTELNGTNNNVIRSFMWGSDLSGTVQGAGGVGGLLQVTYKGAQTTNCFVAFDGNGNAAALADAGSGNVVAQCEYGPFGELLRATGPMARANPSRFSTKYQDDETDLLYYGHRYYNASTGRWITRDPITERGGINLYAFVSNRPIDVVDKLGLCCCGPEVGATLDRTLLEIESAFWRLGEHQKHRACDRVHDILRFLVSGPGWELEPVYTWGAADHEVAFRRKCYYASAVSCAMWGRMNKSCHEAAVLYAWIFGESAVEADWYTEDKAFKWASEWKDLLGDSSDRKAQALAFTRYGYSGKLYHQGIPGCEWNKRTYHNSRTFQWYWEPFRPAK